MSNINLNKRELRKVIKEAVGNVLNELSPDTYATLHRNTQNASHSQYSAAHGDPNAIENVYNNPKHPSNKQLRINKNSYELFKRELFRQFPKFETEIETVNGDVYGLVGFSDSSKVFIFKKPNEEFGGTLTIAPDKGRKFYIEDNKTGDKRLTNESNKLVGDIVNFYNRLWRQDESKVTKLNMGDIKSLLEAVINEKFNTNTFDVESEFETPDGITFYLTGKVYYQMDYDDRYSFDVVDYDLIPDSYEPQFENEIINWVKNNHSIIRDNLAGEAENEMERLTDGGY